jgi:hypothetical protein
MLYAYADPSSRERTSRNTRNFYTILFDNLPSWTKYPKRSRSLVCSTDPSRPRGYGQPFYLFPENGSKIGVCPSYDIWGSFDTVTNDYNLSSFNDYFWMFLRDSMNAIDRSYPAEPKNFAEMVVYFDEIDKHKKYVVQFIKNEFGSTPDSVDFRYKAFPVKEYINTPSMKLIDYLDKMFDPEKNGFMLKTPGNSIPKNRETWTDSPCVMIHYDESVEEDSIYKLLED